MSEEQPPSGLALAAEPRGSAGAEVLHVLLDVRGGRRAGTVALPRRSGDRGSQRGLYGDREVSL